jgi:hypothetical protein
MSHRSTHYWLWFLLFGVIAGLLYYNSHRGLDAESLWLLGSGLLGLLVGAKWLANGKLMQPYDIIIGLIFAAVGIVGILVGFGVHLLDYTDVAGGIISKSNIFGLSLATPFPAVVHALLGVTSLNHGLKGGK